jgi:hypothetical protein
VRPNSSLRWLILAPAVFFAFWPTTAQADPQPGLATTYYTIDEIPPLRSTSEYPICGTETENNINRSYDGEPYENCTGDLFMVHMTGYINIPEHTTIEFMLATDDGGYANIGGNEFEVWNDQHCSWIPSGQLEIEAGIQPLDVWMYENGGSTCIMLAWNIDDEGWSIVPDEAFTQTSTPTTTTSTSTTVPETTTTSTTTTEPATTTTEQTTTTTTVYVAPATTTTTTTTVYVPPVTTTTTTTEPPTTTTSTTTTTTEPPTTTTESTTTTLFVDPVPETTLPSVTVPPQSTTTEPAPTTTTLPEPSEPEQPETEALPETSTEEEVDEFVEELLADVAILEPEQIVEAVEQILATTPTTEQATQLATTSEVLAVVTEEQAEAIFEAVVVEELTAEQGEAIVDAVQEAPKKVREAFEAAINVFTGLFDSYVMVGSTIPVEERRTLVAVSSTMVAVGASLRRRNN